MNDQEGNTLLEELEDTFVTKVITKFKRKSDILDLVLQADSHLVRGGWVGEKVSGFDHHLILFSIKTKHALIENMSMILDSRRASFNLARELLPQVTWADLNFARTDNA